MVRRRDRNGYALKKGESQRKDGRYYYQFIDNMGKRHTVYAKSLLELREKEERISTDLRDGLDFSKRDITLNELFEKYYLPTKVKIKDSSKANYINTWNLRVKKSFLGDMKISVIRQMHIRKFYAILTENGLSKGTINLVHGLIFPTLQLAVDSDIIRKNPAKDCQKEIGGSMKKREALTREQQYILLDFLHNDSVYDVYEPLIIFMLETGCRAGEVLGLTWNDIDFKDNTIHINHQIVYVNLGNGMKFYVTTLKTGDLGIRKIPMTNMVRQALKRQKELMFLLGRRSKIEIDGYKDFIFINQNGNLYSPSSLDNMLNRLVKKQNKLAKKRNTILLPHFSGHILRHTCCTRWAEDGISPKTMQYLMGHANISTTLNTYTHSSEEQAKKELWSIEKKRQLG